MTIAEQQPTSDSMTTDAPLRMLSIDVEEYFHIEAAYGHITSSEWNDWPSRVERNIDLLLSILAEAGRSATFFILGDVAARQPHLVKRISDAGHEVASHGTGHDRLHRLNTISFRSDLLTSKHLLEDQIGKPVVGYRAPTFSVVPNTAWAIDVLLESGFHYDASIFPVTHPAYGVPGAPIQPFFVRGQRGEQTLLEVPPLVWRMMKRNVAVAGGGYFRLLPLWFMKQGLSQAAADQRPAVLYFHPWEFDPDMPRMPLPLTGRLRTYTGLSSAAAKLRSIISQPASWQTIADAQPRLREIAAAQPVFDLKQLEHQAA